MIEVMKVTKFDVPAPERASTDAAGYDLVNGSGVLIDITPGSSALIPTGYAWQIPSGMVGLIRARSGLALHHGIEVMGGVIDSDYRGQVGVILINHGNELLRVAPGMRVAQMIVLPCLLTSVYVTDELSETQRNTGGFGSTGVM